jgi:ATP-binding cassette, subfamily B, bacterial MsbA
VKKLLPVDGLARKIATVNFFLKSFSVPRKSLVLILFLMLAQVFAESFSAMLLMPFLNSLQKVSVNHEMNIILRFITSLFSGIEEENQIVYMLISITLLMSLVQVMTIINNRLILRFAMFKVQYQVSERLFSDILNVRIKFFYSKRSGDLINNLITDVNRAYGCINYLLLIVTNFLFALGYLTAAAMLAPVYTVGLTVVIILFVWLFKFVIPYFHKLGALNRTSQEDANNIIVESMQGFRNVILSCAQSAYLEKFKKVIHLYYHTIYKSSWITTSLPNFIRFLSLLLVTIVLLMNREKLSSGDSLAFSQILFFVYAALNVYRYLATVQTSYSSFAFSFEGVKVLIKLNEDLQQQRSTGMAGQETIRDFVNSIKTKNVSFGYAKDTLVLNKVSFSIPKNKKVAFVGKSGCGKSTLVDLLTGFHEDFSGELLIDDHKFKSIDKQDWRKLLGYVSQETFIFNDTVKNNLIFGLQPEIKEKDIEEACQKAQILETIQSFEKGFDTVLGERGVRISGGEKQRLAIARLFLKKPLIVVLDEATSALDSDSERKVKLAIDQLSIGRTVIAVAHRLSTISDFDIIHVLEKGIIVESGTHDALIKIKGIYYNFYLIQSMGSETNLTK